MTTTEQRPSFDQILAQSQSRSRSGSANSSSLVASLPPPPRRRKPPTPESLTTPSTTSLAMQRLPLTASESQVSISSPFRNPSSIVDGEPGPLRRPNPFTFYDGGHQAHKYADSLSSLNSYSNLFYKPEDDARETPIPTVRQDDDQSSDHASLNDAISVEDYSALLYPELQHGNTPPPRSPRPSIEVHGPPVRKRIPSFASNEGPESPVEFANIGVLSLPPSVSSPDEHRPSKVDRILGMDSSHSSRRGSTEKLIPQSGRRDSFMEFDIVGSRAPITEPQLRSQPSVSDEMPIFAPRHIRSILPNSSIGGYKALLEEVDNKEATDTAPKLDSRQILVDGSDRPRAARSPGSNQGSNRSSAASESLEPRLSTSNFLDKQERADAVRKNRKIAQVLGPGVLPEAQALTRVGRTTPTQDTADSGRDMTYRTGRSYSLALDDARSEAIFKTQARGTRSHRPPALHSKSSWSPLENETIFLGPNGRRHSSPMNPSFDHSKISQRIDSDAMSMSSLGSIITAERRTINTKPARAGSPSSFMEMSDEEGATTPKRRPSIESARQPMQDLKHAGRTASLNDIVTISNALESPRRVSIPDTPFTEHSVPISARHRRSDLSEAPFRGQRDSWDEQIRKDEEQLERQRKREKLAKIHRYLGSKVPPELVLGYSSSTTSPPIEIMVSQTEYVAPPDQKEVKKRRRSSSAVLYQHTQKSDPPRHKEAESRSKDTLTDAERLTKIKRAQKIEQVCLFDRMDGVETYHEVDIWRVAFSSKVLVHTAALFCPGANAPACHTHDSIETHNRGDSDSRASTKRTRFQATIAIYLEGGSTVDGWILSSIDSAIHKWFDIILSKRCGKGEKVSLQKGKRGR